MKNNQKIKTDISIQKISEVINLIGTILGLPTIGSKSPFSAIEVKSLPKLSRTGVI